jgi:branched-chain amino acid aminotransferase
VFRRAANLDRMTAGAAALALPIERGRLEADLDLLLGALPAGEAVIRLTLTRGVGARGLARPIDPHPNVFITHTKWSRQPVMRPVRLATSSIRRNETAPSSRWKTLAYVDAIAAMAEAEAVGADDALQLNGRGDVAATTMANVFAVQGDRLVTPPLCDGVLDGTTRAVVLEAARALGVDAREATLAPTDLAAAEAVFLTNSVRLIVPVAALDRHRFAVDHPLPKALLDGLGARIAAECGRDPRA